MNLDVLLRSSAANKHRRVNAADIVCCLEVPNKLLHYWLKSKERNIVASIKNRGIKTDEMSRTVKPVLADISGPGDFRGQGADKKKNVTEYAFTSI